jgi:hypothetical protein
MSKVIPLPASVGKLLDEIVRERTCSASQLNALIDLMADKPPITSLSMIRRNRPQLSLALILSNKRPLLHTLLDCVSDEAELLQLFQNNIKLRAHLFGVNGLINMTDNSKLMPISISAIHNHWKLVEVLPRFPSMFACSHHSARTCFLFS